MAGAGLRYGRHMTAVPTLRCMALATLLLLPPASSGGVWRQADSLPDSTEVRLDDLSGLIKRRQIRAAVPWSRTDFYIDRGKPRGASAEAIQALEQFINARYQRRLFRIHVVAIPASREELIAMLERGEADIAVAAITITPERAARIDFTLPVFDRVNEVVVSQRTSPLVQDWASLAGANLFIRASSSYADSLAMVNGVLGMQGLPAMNVRYADEHLEDEDILELVNAGIVERTVVDDYKARRWAAQLPDIRIEGVAVRENAAVAWGLRKNTPKLGKLVNEFVRTHRIGTTFGNVVAQRYYGPAAGGSRLSKPLSPRELERYEAVIGLFRKYGAQYGFDHLMLTAQGFQESGLDPRARSREGAIGIMQVLPRTGRAMKVGDIHQTDANIHAGVKYLRELADTYFSDPAIDAWNRTLLSFAAYNAGPGNIRRMQRLASARGLDPHRWFDNVERVTSERIGRQPVDYVANISKYYLAYKRIEVQQDKRDAALDAL